MKSKNNIREELGTKAYVLLAWCLDINFEQLSAMTPIEIKRRVQQCGLGGHRSYGKRTQAKVQSWLDSIEEPQKDLLPINRCETAYVIEMIKQAL
ncbi:MAG: hypothetical protein LBN27_11790 [Prevotellaceae bacterium]|jgi:hypothetical protein|nr:hypothetical protein [Prevotellaceae bacterium]